MKIKIYKVAIVNNECLYVFAFSWEHALVLSAELMKEYPDEFTKIDVEKIPLKDSSNIVIDYNYITQETKKESLKDYYKRVQKTNIPIYGVISDNFIEYYSDDYKR